MSDSQMDTNRGVNVADAAPGQDDNTPKEPPHQPKPQDFVDADPGQDDDTPKEPPPQPKPQDVYKFPTIPNRTISEKEFTATDYKVCTKIGKAVIVSNFMEVYIKIKDHIPREYAADDCKNLEAALKKLGFEPLTGDQSMVNKNLTKPQLEKLYQRAAKNEDYREENKGSTCVLFIVMSYGRSGLITCHPEAGKSTPEIVEQKNILEAFQPQNNPSLALKPKIFIVQTIPTVTTQSDSQGAKEVITTRRIPREADFFTYSCDEYCIDHGNEDLNEKNNFARSIVKVLNDLAEDKSKGLEAMEIQKLFIRINNEYKKYNYTDGKNPWKIPCVTSSLTKQLKLFEKI